MAFEFLPAGRAYGILEVALRFKNESGLARRLNARDPHAMSDLYDRYGRLAYSLTYRMVRDRMEAEDQVQETFLRVWTGVQSFDVERGALGPWILTIARNRTIDFLRSRDGRRSAGSLEIEQLEHPALFTGFDDGALSIDRARRIRAALEKLNPDQRTVIELAYFEGLSQTEMAARMKQPLGTIKTWVRSSMKVLRDGLSQAAIA